MSGALKAATVAVLAAAVVPAATGIAHAGPAPAAVREDVTSLRGNESGIGYFTRYTPNRDGVTTTLDSGTFALSADATAVTISATGGAVVGTVPLTVHTAGQNVALSPVIEDQGATLTLRPVGAPLRDIATSQERWNEQVQRGAFGALIGGTIAGLITIPFWIFVLPLVIGIPIGAAIGFFAAGGQPLIDAGIAYFTGQP